MEDDAGVWCTGLREGLAKKIGDIAELHSGFNVGAALDEGIEDAFDIARDIDNFVEPDWILDSVRFTWEHFLRDVFFACTQAAIITPSPAESMDGTPLMSTINS